MKTLLRAALAGILLAASLFIIVISPLPDFLAGLLEAFAANLVRIPLFQNATALGLATFGLVALAGALSDILVSVLVPMNSPPLRRLLHALGMACVFMIGLASLGSITWQAPTGTSPSAVEEYLADGRLNLAVSGPFAAQAALGFVGYLLVTLIVRPTPRLSRALKGHMTQGEEVVCNIRQTRWKHPITPDSVVATNRRVIVYRPTNLGFTSTLEDYNYVDIANIKIHRGWLFSSITLQARFEGDDLVFQDIPKSGADAFARVVTEQLRAFRGQVPLTPSASSGAGIGTEARRNR